MRVKNIITELVMLVGYGLVEWLVNRLIRRQKKPVHLLWVWTTLLIISCLINLTFYWFAYPVIIWMLIGIGLVIHQLWASHQFLYQRFWPRFWQLTVFFWLVAFVLSLLGNRLPVV